MHFLRLPIVKILTACSFFLGMAAFSAVVFGQGWYGGAAAGLGITTNGIAQNVTLFDSPAPGLTNNYASYRATQLAGFVGIDAGYQLALSSAYELALGLQADYLNYDQLTGRVHPLVNVSPNFATLNYQLNAESFMLLVQMRALWHWKPLWQPYFSVALGSAWNRLSGYTETIPQGSTALPSASLFGNNTSSDFAYGFGLGVQHLISKNASITMDYRFYSAGDAALLPSAVQGTGNQINSGTLSAHLIVLGLSFA
ncbi:MAG: outer membrane beta-barrel protein [Coxiellaceae bacterium]|nr:outer membrane beta-barrel protein [Coxiellaceae bacterium]